ncbi:ATP-binding cassette domain-containing protein [Micromonospora sp. C28SCA-DRY-2]|uniref:ABC transporter ATP-binding protein n=1 Tax=Micromonospora sp. C28SCA-DRY-2 TaxID=3059522 RepID=UPI0026768FA4|nr:ATP-binding cassette domain-containing protein [Micromonospora sp. C28SCA-DRY-2]MDO3702617.1 ATP-binding cassette domain-containing protein [Micromonospora sp. C28SCA-DRY-2]
MRLENVWLRYRRRGPWVLRGTQARIGPGEVVVVLGRNGAGKSTLLQVAAGVLRPVRGRVAERPGRVGWVPERFPADQPFTVQRYLTAMARVAGLDAPAAGRAVADWTSRLGLSAFRAVRLPELSKGTAQKVGLAQAMLRPPGLLVLDEPWEGLDAGARELVPAVIDEVLATGGSVLVSDHRGETVRLPGARHWTVADGTVTEEAPSAAAAMAVVEVAVPAARVAGAVARLRAEGHHVLRVRPGDPPAEPASTGPGQPDTDPALPGLGQPGADPAPGPGQPGTNPVVPGPGGPLGSAPASSGPAPGGAPEPAPAAGVAAEGGPATGASR